MSGSNSIEAPYVLASLPKPFDAASGQTFASPVYGHRGQKRRKRPEIAVSIDGEGLNIYNIRNPRLITSYALSPQTKFLCQPCSIHRKYTPSQVPTRQIAQRLTYAVTSETRGKKAELVCFVEEAQKSPALNAPGGIQDKRSFTLDSNSAVSTILAVTVNSEASEIASALDICVVYENGEVLCISGDLTTRRWHYKGEEGQKVEFAALFDAEAAYKGLLKNREDALAALEDPEIGHDTTGSRTLLALIGASPQTEAQQHVERQFSLFSLPPRSRDLISSVQRGPQELLSYQLPTTTPSKTTSKAAFLLQASSGRLQQLLAGFITSYDLSGTIPRTLSVLPAHEENGFQSFTRLSPTSVLASEARSCGIYDTTYSSVQATFSLDTAFTTPVKQNKKVSGVAEEPLDFVSFFSEIGLAVALRGNSLVGMQINHVSATRKRGKARAGLLVESLGKGINAPGKSTNSASNEPAFITWKARVDSLVDDADVEGLEKFIADELSISRVKSADAPKTEDGPAKGVADSIDESKQQKLYEWRFNKDISALIGATERRKALYCLSKFFAFGENTQNSAIDCQPPSIIFFAPNMFKWLGLTGFLTADMINRAKDNGRGRATNTVRPGDLVRAIHDFDPSLGLMHEVLSWPIYLEVDEVVQCLKAIIESLESPADSEEARRITNGDDEEVMVNGELESAVESEVEAADEDLAFALASLNDGLAIRSLALRAVFSRLHSFPAKRIVKAFRSALTQKETVFFIQLLRIELADGSWTTRYVDSDDESERQDGPSDRSITIIGNLLNIAIDAIGTSGWLVGLGGDAQLSTDEMLVMLRAETNAALEGCYEASTLGVYLNDFERYSNLQQKTGHKRKREIVDPVKNPGFLVKDETEDPVLPLGYKVQKIDRTRLTAGGQVRVKSKSAIGREISMRVGKYSMDRIRV